MNWTLSIRWALTIFMCAIVWQNAHWSVALAITFVSVAIEGLASSISIVGKALKAHIQKGHD